MAGKPELQPGEIFDSPYHGLPRQKKGCGCLQLLGCGVIVGGILLVSACVAGYFYIRQANVTDPLAREQLAAELIDWDFNDRLPTLFAFDTFVSTIVVKGSDEEGLIVMIDPGIFGGPETGYPIETDEGARFDFGTSDDFEKTDVVEHDTRTIVVGPHELKLTFNRTRGRKTGTIYWEILGVFPGTRGPCIAVIRLPESAWSDERIEEVIRTMRVP